MSYNYRIIATPAEGGGQLLSICEVWYDSQGTPIDHNEPMPIDALTIGELSGMVGSFNEALALPILHESEFKTDEDVGGEVAVLHLVVIEGGHRAAAG
jgi:hypothetical protein